MRTLVDDDGGETADRCATCHRVLSSSERGVYVAEDSQSFLGIRTDRPGEIVSDEQ